MVVARVCIQSSDLIAVEYETQPGCQRATTALLNPHPLTYPGGYSQSQGWRGANRATRPGCPLCQPARHARSRSLETRLPVRAKDLLNVNSEAPTGGAEIWVSLLLPTLVKSCVGNRRFL